jgi:hypothetical protein
VTPEPAARLEARRQLLSESWLANEQTLADAYDLKAGRQSPLDRVEDLERDQDLIEGELGEMYLQQCPDERSTQKS